MDLKPVSGNDAAQDLILEIIRDDHKKSDWYVGITASIERRVFGEHGVPTKGHPVIYRRCTSEDEARDAEKALLESGCKGGQGGGGDEAPDHVYAYLMTNETTP